MLIIDEGKKKVEGVVASLIDPARTLVELELSDPEKAVALLESTRWFPYLQKTTRHSLQFQMPKEWVPDLNRELVEQQIPVLSLQVKNSLEAYFLSLTRTNQYVAAFTD